VIHTKTPPPASPLLITKYSPFAIQIQELASVYALMNYGLGVDSAFNGNEYQEYFLEGKDGRCVRLTSLPPSCANRLSRPAMGLLTFHALLIYVTTCTTYTHKIQSLATACPLDCEYDQVTTQILKVIPIRLNAVIQNISSQKLLWPSPGQRNRHTFKPGARHLRFTTHQVTTETEHRVTRVRTEANNTFYALFHNFDDPIATYAYTLCV
jgi:hypothetical protein